MERKSKRNLSNFVKKSMFFWFYFFTSRYPNLYMLSTVLYKLKQKNDFFEKLLKTVLLFYCLILWLYFSRVAFPPRICLSLKFLFNTSRTRSYSVWSINFKRSETSLCTVDLLILKCAEHALTVQSVSTIYSAHFIILSSIYSHNFPTSELPLRNILCRKL